MKKSIIKTFTVLFIIIVLVDVLLFSITSGVSTASIMGEIANNFYGIWIFLSVAGLLALVFTFSIFWKTVKLRETFMRISSA